MQELRRFRASWDVGGPRTVASSPSRRAAASRGRRLLSTPASCGGSPRTVASSPSRGAVAASRGRRLLSTPARCGGGPRTVASSPSRRAAAVSRGWRLLSIPARCGGVPRTRRWPQHGALLLWRSGIYEAEAAEAATATAERRADGGAHSARLACGFFKKKTKVFPECYHASR
jgi:hypothetical protein